jgi:predicted nucleotidyltransferase
MSKFQQILDSFSVRDTLNPKIWESPDDPQKATMLPKVQKGLMRISEEFIEYLGDEVFVEDIVLTGSLANFNWSEFSDFDLHIIVDLQQYEDEAELYKELFNLKKQVFNDKHDIKIFGYDVELYVQDSEEPHFATGVYSIMNDEWVTKPKKFKNEIDKSVLEKKIKNWTEKIDKALDTEHPEDNAELIDSIKEKIKDYRKSGLEKEGELSYENLVFKFLRRSGHIEKLFDSSNKALDKELSIERKLEETHQ